jgi:hypothetical protein
VALVFCWQPSCKLENLPRQTVWPYSHINIQRILRILITLATDLIRFSSGPLKLQCKFNFIFFCGLENVKKPVKNNGYLFTAHDTGNRIIIRMGNMLHNRRRYERRAPRHYDVTFPCLRSTAENIVYIFLQELSKRKLCLYRPSCRFFIRKTDEM